jgi:1,4-dihydroxy-2-naphthoyl-CoA hydrolase
MTPPPKFIPQERTYDALLGVEYDPTAEGDVCATVPVRDSLCQPMGLVHGGVYASIAESLATVATIYRVHQDGTYGVGLSNQTSFLRPILEGSIHATARVCHSGRTTWIWDVEFHDDEERLCAVCRMTIAIRPQPGA